MTRPVRTMIALGLLLATPVARGGEPAPPDPTGPQAAPSFVKDIAPILARHCVGCHNARRSEGRYDLTSFAKLKAGPPGGEAAITAGDPEASLLVEVIRPDGQPRMPFKQAPLDEEKVAAIERWIARGARYDGDKEDEDWVTLVHKRTPVNIPASYPVPVPVSGLAFAPNGRDVLTSGYHELLAWDATRGRLAGRTPGLPERIQAIAFSPDGRWLATAGGDPGLLGGAKLWRVAPDGLKPARDLVEGPDSFFAATFSPNSQLVAVAGSDRAVRIWEVESGREVATIEDHADWVLGIAFSPDGQRIATASRDKTSKVFNVRTKESLVAFSGHAETVYSVAFHPDGKHVATGGGDGLVRVWSPEDGKPGASFAGFGGPVLRVVYTPDGQDLIASSTDGNIRFFRGDQKHRELRAHRDWIYSLALSPDGKRLASGSWDGEVRLWNVSDGTPGVIFRAAPGLDASAKPAESVH
jgi:WD40 repeat protein